MRRHAAGCDATNISVMDRQMGRICNQASFGVKDCAGKRASHLLSNGHESVAENAEHDGVNFSVALLLVLPAKRSMTTWVSRI
ncbi:hypothetical protein HYQ46_012493 [Verticillium longisporum]|nr:hypothetical protein HYQ46_012493 [Verticillium longisporum]